MCNLISQQNAIVFSYHPVSALGAVCTRCLVSERTECRLIETLSAR